MDECEWVRSEEPVSMLSWLTANRPATSPRKFRLFCVAACRRVWALLPDEMSRRAVLVGECRADGDAGGGGTNAGIKVAWQEALAAYRRAVPGPAAWIALSAADCCQVDGQMAHVAVWMVRTSLSALDGRFTPAAQADLLREIFGNPFRPVPSEPCAGCSCGAVPTDRDDNTCPCYRGTGRRFPRRWLTRTVLSVARRAYEERQHDDGHLDPSCLAVLADALEEAGCEDGPLLWHLRGQYETAPEWWYPPSGIHVCGCWALDAVLGKG